MLFKLQYTDVLNYNIRTFFFSIYGRSFFQYTDVFWYTIYGRSFFQNTDVLLLQYTDVINYNIRMILKIQYTDVHFYNIRTFLNTIYGRQYTDILSTIYGRSCKVRADVINVRADVQKTSAPKNVRISIPRCDVDLPGDHSCEQILLSCDTCADK